MGSYRTFVKINYLLIELIRQFYSEIRSFRITNSDGTFGFSDYSNENILKKDLRHPVFDITVKAHKKSPYSRISQNEMAKELFRIGFFNPQHGIEALSALEIMDFEGKASVEAKIRENVKSLRSEQL